MERKKRLWTICKIINNAYYHKKVIRSTKFASQVDCVINSLRLTGFHTQISDTSGDYGKVIPEIINQFKI